MAYKRTKTTNKEATKSNKYGIDRWTSNGHGISVDKNSINKKAVEEANKIANRKKGK